MASSGDSCSASIEMERIDNTVKHRLERDNSYNEWLAGEMLAFAYSYERQAGQLQIIMQVSGRWLRGGVCRSKSIRG